MQPFYILQQSKKQNLHILEMNEKTKLWPSSVFINITLSYMCYRCKLQVSNVSQRSNGFSAVSKRGQ